jgi:hypothetical protein
MKASLSVITTACLLVFLTLSTSDAAPTFTQDGQIRFKTTKEIGKEAKQSQTAFLSRRAEMKNQLENEISVTEARFGAKKKKLEKDMMKKKSQMMDCRYEFYDTSSRIREFKILWVTLHYWRVLYWLASDVAQEATALAAAATVKVGLPK